MKAKIQAMINAGFTMEQWESRYHNGLVDSTVWPVFLRVCDWLAPRFSGPAGYRQEAFFNRYGSMAYWQKINKHRRAFNLPSIAA